MKNLIVILIIGLYSQSISSQNKEKKFIMFDSLSNETYVHEIGNGKKENTKVYTKNRKKNGDINFYIRKELFHYSSVIDKIDTCNIEYLKVIKISNIDSLKEDVNKINPLYPYKVYPNLYIVEKVNDSTIVKHKVKWEYYIE